MWCFSESVFLYGFHLWVTYCTKGHFTVFKTNWTSDGGHRSIKGCVMFLPWLYSQIEHNWIRLTGLRCCALWSPWCLCDCFPVFTKQWKCVNQSVLSTSSTDRLFSVLCCSTSNLKESEWCVKCVFCNDKYSSFWVQWNHVETMPITMLSQKSG